MKIAVVGSGISGMSAAYMLHSHHDVTLFENEPVVGGHSRTVTINSPEHGHHQVPVDTGFIVFNKRNYPLLTALFEHLAVPVVKSNMSFGISIDNGWLEYGTLKPTSLFAQLSNTLRPHYWKMLIDIVAFNKGAGRFIDTDLSVTLGDLVRQLNLGEWFQRYYLLPMGASIWSTPYSKMLQYPARTFTQFFMNHGLLTVTDHPQWYTVEGGSRNYVEKLTAPFKDKIVTNCAVTNIMQKGDRLEVADIHGGKSEFDHVILACHADQALNMLTSPTREQQEILSAFSYQENDMVLHSDVSFMPKRQRAWSSWVYRSESRSVSDQAVSLSYWMNNLQPLKTQRPVIVTLNPGREPDESLVYDRKRFTHPIFNKQAIEAQSKIDAIQGQQNIWYCGAYQRYGFHEDGLWSAVNVAKKLRVTPEWLPQ